MATNKNNIAFFLYLVFIVSWFLHLGYRLPLLGNLRLDFILVILITFILIMDGSIPIETIKALSNRTSPGKVLSVISLYILVTIPFVEWPGSVLKFGLENYLKAIIFYYFTIRLVTTLSQLKTFLSVFIACQIFRVLEPLYLHITTGYWGSFASLDNWEFIDRLSGSPYDVVNPNGLAFIIDTIIPFIYFTCSLSRFNLALASFLLPILLYTLTLTGSRSGFIGLLTILVGIILKSRHQVKLSLLIITLFIIGFQSLDEAKKDRYFSIIYTDTANAATSAGRLDGILRDLHVATRRPLFGHGLTTSRDANANFDGRYQLSHNLYTEVAQELGFIGLALFIFYIHSIVFYFLASSKNLKICKQSNNSLTALANAMHVWLGLCIVFSLASYGLTSYEWYLLGGLSMIMIKLTNIDIDSTKNTVKRSF